jgi:hypothetical protein
MLMDLEQNATDSDVLPMNWHLIVIGEGVGVFCLYVVTDMVFVQSCPGGTYQEF